MNIVRIIKWNNKLVTFNDKLIRTESVYTPPAPPPYTTDGLVMEYKFDNNCNDTYGHNGTFNGTPRYNIGIDGSCAEFQLNGADYISLDTSYGQVTYGLNPYTVAVWFKVNTLPSYQIVIGMYTTGGTTTNENHALQLLSDGTLVVYGERTGTGTRQQNSNVGDFVTGTWYFTASGYTGTKMFLKVYKVGTGLIRDVSTASSISTNGTNVANIGRWGFNGGPFNGFIDQFRVYTRVLTDAEIAQLWNSGVGH